MSSPAPGLAAARHLLDHPELAERARPFLAGEEIDWNGLWRTPPWSSREERVLRAAADLAGAHATRELTPVTLSQLADAALWDPTPYSRSADDHSHRVLEALGICHGLDPAGVRVWLSARYDAVARAMDVWDWGALPTEVDAASHILGSRRMAPRTEHHTFVRVWPRVFESLATEQWSADEQVMVDAARALALETGGPTLHELATRLDDEQLAVVVEGLYIAWFEPD